MRDAGPLDMNQFGSVKQDMTECWSDAALAGEALFSDSRDECSLQETSHMRSASQFYAKTTRLSRENRLPPLL